MLKIFLCLVLFSKGLHQYVNAQISFSSVPCQQRQAKIVGGEEAKHHEIPSIVSLTRRGGHFCGATIIHEKWLLTAGHCICNGLNQFMKPSQIQGVMGLHSISQYMSGDNGPLQTNFKDLIPHPKYKCTQPENDIALLELMHPIEFTHHIQPSCLMTDNRNRNHENELAIVSGWGWTHENQENGDRADVLQKAAVRIWNNNVCQRSYQMYSQPNSQIFHTQLCAGYENGGIDSCWADSGGPLMSQENFVIGVVSTGIGCARPGLPGIYTRVSKYLNWIQTVIYSRR